MASSEMEELPVDIALDDSAVSTAAENSQDSQEEAESGPIVDHEQREKLVKLPIGRVRNIVKMDPDVNLVNQEAVFLITKSAVIYAVYRNLR